jgi:acetylornithine/N-succinyldiaminopimelate aminotransferase
MIAGSHGSTFGGNPMAMAAGNAVLDVMLEPGFLEAVRQRALLLKQKLAGIKDLHSDVIEAIRGEGLLIGLKCKGPSASLSAALLQERLLSIGAGDNVVRLLPSLIVTEAEIAEACDKIEAACAAVARARTSEDVA